MPIAMSCPNCRLQINAPDHLAGKQGKCPKCGSAILIPAQHSAEAETELQLQPFDQHEAPPQMAPAPAPAAAPHAAHAPAGMPDLPPTPPPAYERARIYTQDGSSPLPKILIGVAVLAVVGVAGWFAFKAFSGGNSALELAAQAPKNTSAVVAVSEPQKLLVDSVKSIDATAAENKQLGDAWTQAKSSGRAKLGFDFTDPAAYEKAGVNLTKPATFALLGLQKGVPAGAVFSLAVNDEKVALDTVRNIANTNKTQVVDDKAADPAVALVGDDLAAATCDGRLWLLVAPKTDGPLNAKLRGFLQDGKADALSAAPGVRTTIKTLPAGDISGVVNLKGIFESLNKVSLPKITGDLVSLGFSARQEDSALYLLLSETAELKKYLTPGASCRDFLAQTEKPLFALTYSLAEPVKLIRYFVESGGGAVALGQFNAVAKNALGVDLDELDGMLKNGAGGVVLFPPKTTTEIPSVMLFLRLADLDKATRAVEKVMGNNPAVEHQRINNRSLYNTPGFIPMSVCIVGDYLLIGTAQNQIKALARDEKKGWTPMCGGSEQLAIEVFMGDLAKFIAQKTQAFAPAGTDPGKTMDKLFKPEAHMLTLLTLKGDGLLLNSKSEGAGGSASMTTMPAVIAAVAIPSLLRSRMAANQTAAAAACKAFAEAEEIYRRTDYNQNKVLEYAQSLRGAYSLFETAAGKGDLSLIDKSFADAEGEPGSNAIPKAGYCFKVLKAQGPAANGGKRSYIVNGAMTLGYALVAYPAVYDSTGRDTFMINNVGTIFQKDLGPQTHAMVKAMTEFNPEQPGWVPAE